MSGTPEGGDSSTGWTCVPPIIEAAGTDAVRAYGSYLEHPSLAASTRNVYADHCRRFFEWAARRGLALEAITSEVLAEYRNEIAARTSRQYASASLSPVHGAFRALTAGGVTCGLSLDPRRPRKSRQPRANATTGTEFPLLPLMSMLAHMEARSLETILDDDRTAETLLDFVRWRDGRRCSRCDAPDSESADTIGGSVHGYRCNACGCTYRVIDGSPFDGIPLTLKDGLFLLHERYCRDDEAPRKADDRAAERRINAEHANAFLGAIEIRLIEAGLHDHAAFRLALDRVYREMGQDEIARDIIEYAELETCREALLRAKAEGTSVEDLPPDMTLDAAIEFVNARLAEHDRVLIGMEDGYLVRKWPEAANGEAEPGAEVNGNSQEGNADGRVLP